jgi:hypothetical protein
MHRALDTAERGCPITRRYFVTAGLVALAVAIAPSAALPQTPAGDSVTGTATLVEAGPAFRFDAHSGPSGENPQGTITRLDPAGGPPTTASVDCLAVHGNRATVGAVAGEFPPIHIVAFIEDNDGAGVDRFLGLSGIPGCPLDPPAGTSLAPIFSGDLTVVDASPPPTSKDQCKNGGWRTYGVFKNQGDCISFVGKNPPAS